jgi:hypothetical protein
MEKKNNSWKLLGMILGAVFVVWITFNFLLPLAFKVLSIVGGLVIVGAIGYGAYRMMSRKSLSGGRRTLP